MSNRFPRPNAGSTDQSANMFLAPARALSLWNPFLAGALGGDARAHEEFATIASEWQDFMGRRLNEDFLLVQRLTRSRTPDQILAAYTVFWQKAAEDYGNEATTISKLMAGVTTEMLAAAQSATDEASAPLREAARTTLAREAASRAFST